MENEKGKIMKDLFKSIGAFILLMAISWICTCGLIKIFTWCFDWQFDWKIATGIWIIWCMLNSIFSKK